MFNSLYSAGFLIALLSSVFSNQINFANNNVLVMWEVVGQKIELEIIAKTTGYVGLGFTASGSMIGADIIIGGVDASSGKPYLSDRHSTQFAEPLMDKSQDCQLLAAEENGTHTRLKFTRPLNTCDQNDWNINEDTIKLIYALGETDDITYHGTVNRGSISVNLLDPDIRQPDLTNYKIFDMTVDMVMPAIRTSYWCTIHKTPSFTSKQHMVGYDAVRSNAAAYKHVHHVEITKCDPPKGKDSTETFGPFVGKPGVECFNSSSSNFPRKYCSFSEFVWASGGLVSMFPDHVGLPLHPDQYFMMEIHYDNPNEEAGIRFQSGMRLYYTDKLRKYDVGKLRVGAEVSFTHLVPPNTKGFTTVAHCHPNCTKYFPPLGIKVVSILLHSHLSGRKIKTRHFRNGQELKWPLNDQHYDFNYQQNRELRTEIEILPGDHLTTECVYDSDWKKGKPVIGGRGTDEEMCIAFYFYYPRLENISECNSEFPRQKILDFFNIQDVVLEEGEEDPMVISPLKQSGKRFTQIVMEFNWTARKQAEYQKAAQFGLLEGYCTPTKDRFLTGYPDKYVKYEPKDKCEKAKKL